VELFAFYAIQEHYLKIGYESNSVTSIKILLQADGDNHPSQISDLAACQIGEYLNGVRTFFDFPVLLHGTPFQHLVWSELCRIPYWQTRTYGQIAAAIGKPKAARAVGMACNKNPLWIVVPCHRVIGQDKKLTGYACGLEAKQFLLDLENPK
jgi:methylated-DNA-[protein]-cysteine S-methyltransferase